MSETYYSTCGALRMVPRRAAEPVPASGARSARSSTAPSRRASSSRRGTCTAIPDWLPDERARRYAEPLACVCQCLADPPVVSAGDRVLVTGPGPVGLLAAQVARAHGRRGDRASACRRTSRASRGASALGFSTAARPGCRAVRRRRRVLGRRRRRAHLPRGRSPARALRPGRRLRQGRHRPARPGLPEGAHRHLRLRRDAAGRGSARSLSSSRRARRARSRS